MDKARASGARDSGFESRVSGLLCPIVSLRLLSHFFLTIPGRTEKEWYTRFSFFPSSGRGKKEEGRKEKRAPSNLGWLLYKERQDMDDAEAAYRAAIAADPRQADAHKAGQRSRRIRGTPSHTNLGLLLQHERQDIDGAEAAYRAVIAADPGYTAAHTNLGWLLQNERPTSVP